MKSWVVTGGAGTGKSSFCRLLCEKSGSQVALFSCDVQVHILLGDQPVIQRLCELFGPGILDEGSGQIDRAKLRALVFEDEPSRRRLEAELHPLVLRELEAKRAEAESSAKAKVFVAEVPLYHEIGASVKTDKVIVVAASRSVQRSRLMEHRQLDEQTAERMLDSQLPMAEKISRADLVVWNDGASGLLEAQALALLREHL